MIISILSAEFIKISRSKTLRILLATVGFSVLLFIFLISYLFNAIPKTLVETWEGNLTFLLIIWQFFAFLLTGTFLIFWQRTEHKADSFNRSLMLPYEFWHILLMRFLGFIVIYSGVIFIAYLLIFLFLPLFFFAFNPQYAFQNLNLLGYVPYFFFSWLGQVILLIPTFLFLFLFSTKISHLAVNVLVLISIILTRQVSLFSSWFFLNLFEESQKMIKTMFLPTGSGLYKMHELLELYFYSFVWTGLFAGILIYFSRFFYPNKS